MVLAAPGVSSLSATALRVLLALLSHASFKRLDGVVWPTVALLEANVHRGERQVTRALRELEDAGLLKSLSRSRSGGRRRRLVIPQLFATAQPDTVWQGTPSPGDSLPQTSGVTRTETGTEPFRTQPQNSSTATSPPTGGEDPVPLAALVGKYRGRPEPGSTSPPRRTRTSGRYDALPPSAFTSRDAMWTALREASAHRLLDVEPNSEAHLLAWTTLAHFARRRSISAEKAGGYLRRVLEQHEGSLERAAGSVSIEFEEDARRWLHRHR